MEDNVWFGTDQHDTFFPHSTQVVQVHDSKMGNEKDAECSKEIAEQAPFPDCSREEKIDNNGFEPVSSRDTDYRKEVSLSSHFLTFLKG